MPVISFLARQPVSRVTIAVDSEVAALARANDVGRVQADGVTVAEVGNGEHDAAPGPAGGPVVGFYAASEPGVGAVHPTLAGALAAALGAAVADLSGEGVPSGRVVGWGHGHELDRATANTLQSRLAGAGTGFSAGDLVHVVAPSWFTVQRDRLLALRTVDSIRLVPLVSLVAHGAILPHRSGVCQGLFWLSPRSGLRHDRTAWAWASGSVLVAELCEDAEHFLGGVGDGFALLAVGPCHVVGEGDEDGAVVLAVADYDGVVAVEEGGKGCPERADGDIGLHVLTSMAIGVYTVPAGGVKCTLLAIARGAHGGELWCGLSVLVGVGEGYQKHAVGGKGQPFAGVAGENDAAVAGVLLVVGIVSVAHKAVATADRDVLSWR